MFASIWDYLDGFWSESLQVSPEKTTGIWGWNRLFATSVRLLSYCPLTLPTNAVWGCRGQTGVGVKGGFPVGLGYFPVVSIVLSPFSGHRKAWSLPGPGGGLGCGLGDRLPEIKYGGSDAITGHRS
ncbi:unnamed protein product [Cuscuta europaea]|uniref:Uncharacterized protein n=1 Tax=Cuscuta europaea TaxID=41803 RepID=A0A9P0Z1C0_CUSEU|nr:unnamed protein product [Cuscuta europaea]